MTLITTGENEQLVMVGIRDIAERLNISVASVSRALNNEPYVNEALRRRVVDEANLLGYRPKQSGRSLRRGVSSTIGFMIETHPTDVSHVDVFLMSIFDGVQSVMVDNNLSLVVLPCSANEDPIEYLKSVVERRSVDGIILSSTRPNDARIDMLEKVGIPFITLGRTGQSQKHAWIDLDFERFAEESVDRLFLKGHHRIALMAPARPMNFGRITTMGYKAALARRNIPVDPSLIVKVLPDEASGYSACDALLRCPSPPTAIILIHQGLAPGVYRRLDEAGLYVGKDIAVLGLQDGWQGSISPTLTTFRFATHDIGIALGRALLASMPAFAARYNGAKLQQLWPFKIFQGESDRIDINACEENSADANACDPR